MYLSCLVFKAVPSLRVRYGDVAQNGPADDVVAVATGPIFLKGTELTTESIQTVTSLKMAPFQVDYFCLADCSVRVKCASDVYAAVLRKSSFLENSVKVRNLEFLLIKFIFT